MKGKSLCIHTTWDGGRIQNRWVDQYSNTVNLQNRSVNQHNRSVNQYNRFVNQHCIKNLGGELPKCPVLPGIATKSGNNITGEGLGSL